MGYRLLYDNKILYDVYSDEVVYNATLTNQVNTNSYLDFTIAATHSLYSVIKEKSGIVDLYFDDTHLFSGEITEITEDSELSKSVTCSGALAYLKDTLVRPYSTINGEYDLTAPATVDGYFKWLIDQHNANCSDSRKKFSIGVNQGNLLDKNNYIYRSSSQYPTTSSEIEDKILNTFGGYLFVRFDGYTNILDLYADVHEANNQIIDFGVNIVDFSKTTSTDNQYTAVIATGYTPDPPEDNPEKKMDPIDLTSIADGMTNNSGIMKLGDKVYNADAVRKYGYKEYYASNEDITTYDGLLDYACRTLNTLMSPTLSIEVKAVDLALYMNNGYEHLQIGQAARIRSRAHNVDEYLMVNSISLDLQDPSNTEYQLGVSYDTLTGQQSSYLKSLNAGINKSLDSVAAIDQVAKDAAKEATEASTKANQANETANNASSKADEATNTANNASSKADQANETANEASSKADSANSTANEANAKAEEANSTANSANEKSDAAKKASEDAVTNAEAAKKAAEDATTNANSAIESANTANSKAEEANTKSDEAKTDAANASAVAAAASTAADEAKANASKTQQEMTDYKTATDKTLTDIDASITGINSSIETIDSSIDTINGSITNINGNISAVDAAVKKAQSDATSGINQAKAAQTAADKANNDLSDYKTTTDAAVDKAQKAADKAQSDLNEYIESANAGISANDAAVKKAQAAADAAQKAADAAQADATANAKAVGIAQSTADAARSEAAKAQEKADNTASGLDATKATVEQHTTELGELSTKVTGAVKDANSALTASTEAKQTATEASTKATTAYNDSQTALTNSTEAKQTATEAKTTADSAYEDSQTALTNSSSAVQTANTVQTTLSTNYYDKTHSDNTYATKSSLTETSESIKMEVEKTYATKTAVEALQNIADNAIESWRGTGVPTASNKPASDWTTPELKKRHSGDLYYDKATGKAYRWGSDDGVTYTWELNQDTDVTKALADAAAAQKSADSAQGTADSAVSAASNAQYSANKAQQDATAAGNAAKNAQTTADAAQSNVEKLETTVATTYVTKSSFETTADAITSRVDTVSETANSAVTAASKAQQTADSINVDLSKNYQTKAAADNVYATKTSLSATAESLATTIEKAQSTADGAVNAASHAQQTADAVTLDLSKNYQTKKAADEVYATKTSLTATAEGLTTSVNKAQSTADSAVTAASKAQQTADGISVDLSKNYYNKTQVDSEINGISVGGRNYVLDSGRVSYVPNRIDNTHTKFGNNSIKLSITNNSGSNVYDVISYRLTVTDLSEYRGKDLAISAWVYVDPDYEYNGIEFRVIYTREGLTMFSGVNTSYPNVLIPAGSGWTRLYGIFSIPEDSTRVDFNVTTYASNGSSTIWLSSPKLEIGTKATDWTPAPEDMADKVYTNAQIKASADAITTTVSKAQTTADSAVTAASKAQQTADNISLNLTKNYQTKADSDALYATQASLNATANAITSEVSETYATKEALSATDANVTKAQQTADSGVSKANAAQSTADGVKSDLKTNYTTTVDMNSKIEQSASGITSEVSKNYATKTELSTTNSNVSKAQSTADKAQSTADSATTAASKAQSTANSATTAASNAQSTADTAKANAATAQDTADGVKSDLKTNYTTTVDMNSKIEQTASSITQTVSETYATKEALSTTNSNVSKAQTAADKANTDLATANKNLADAKANLESLQNQANATDADLSAAKLAVEEAQRTADTAKANAKTAQDDVNAVKTRVSSAETKIAQNSSDISLRATKTEVTNAVNGISVGGRNLITNTGDGFKFTDGWAQSTSTWVPKGYYEYACYRIPSTDPYYETKIGDTITISFDVELYAADNWFLTVYDSNGHPSVSFASGSAIYNSSVEVGKLNKLRGYTVRTLLDMGWTESERRIEFYCGYGSGSYFKISHLKIERGNKPTDWTPAPEDVSTDATTKANNALTEAKSYADSQLKISADSITSEVSKTYATKTELGTTNSNVSKAQQTADKANTDLGTFKNTVETNYATNSKLEQTASGITSSVSSTYATKEALSQTNSNVSAAQSTADTAKANAKTAQDTADGVKSDLKNNYTTTVDMNSKISQTAAGITSDVSKTYATKEALSQTNSNVSAAQSTADTAKANAKTAQDTADGVKSDLKNNYTTTVDMNSKISQTAAGITSDVSKTYATKEALSQTNSNVSAAQSTADTAKANAKTAQDTADGVKNDLKTNYTTTVDMNSKLEQTASSITSEVSKNYATKSTVESLQNIADNAIESWYLAGVPTASNKPASDWTTDALKKQHSGDIYYDKNTGYSYRWLLDGTAYSWVRIKDNDITDAKNAANEAKTAAGTAQDTADGVKNDLKTNYTTTVDMNSKISQTAAGITSDVSKTYATKEALATTNSNVTNAQSTADTAKANAKTAQDTADGVKSDLKTNYTTTVDMNSKISQSATDIKSEVSKTYATKEALFTTDSNVTAAKSAADKAQQIADGVKSDLKTNYTTTVDMDSKIEQTASEITSTVSSTYATKTALANTDANVNKAQQTADGVKNDLANNYSTTVQMNSAIKQSADNITSEVSKTYQVKGDYATNADVNSKISQSATDIKSEVSKTYATKDEFSNLSVGGRNLARNTSDEWSDWITPRTNATNVTHDTGVRIYFTSEIQKDDQYMIQIELEFDGVTASSGARSYFSLQGAVDGKWEANKFNPWSHYIYGITDGFVTIKKLVVANVTPEPAETYAEANFRIDDWASGRYRYRRIKVEIGNKATDWSPAPEDTVNAIDSINSNLETNYVTNSKLEQTASGITSSVSENYQKKGDYPTKSEMNSAISQSASSITSTVSNTYATKTELSTTNSNVSKAQTTANNAQNIANAKGIDYSQGKMLHTDPYFLISNNNINPYNNSNNGNVYYGWSDKSSDNPIKSANRELVFWNKGAANPSLGGFYFADSTRANCILITRFIAKVPDGATIVFASNDTGDGGNANRVWLTSNKGNGTFKEYVFKVIAGSTGTFSTTNFFYIGDMDQGTADNPVEIFRLAYATVFDMTDISDTQTNANALSSFKNTVETTYATNTKVEQLSDSITSTASEVTTVKTDLAAAKKTASDAATAASNAQSTADTAKANAATAQSTADTAKANAATAQNKADEAAKNLATAETNLKNLQSQANATDEQLTAAKEAVANAKAAADAAQADATAAATAASNAQSTADTAKANAATAQNKATEAKSAADKAQQDVNAVTNRVTTAETTIAQNTKDITLRATKDEVTSAVSNIRVGGENLIKGSAGVFSHYGFNMAPSDYSWKTGTVGTNYLSKFQYMSWIANYNGYISGPYFNTKTVLMKEDFRVGETYTLSFWAKCDKTGGTKFTAALCESHTWVATPSVTLSTDWQRMVCTFTAKVVSSNICFYVSTTTDLGRIYICGLKLEVGNKNTDWSPAPQDITNEAHSYADAQIKVSADNITSTVSSTYAKKGDLSDYQKKTLPDTRNDNQNPGWYMKNYPRQVVSEFKYANVIGLSNGDMFCSLETTVPWGDSSGGCPKQRAQCNDKVYYRSGTSDSEWSTWKETLDLSSAESTYAKSSEVKQTVDGIETKITTVTSTANSAKSTAESAASDASSALTKANAAASDAATAKSDASSAKSTANTANSTASSANSKATTAATDAAAAKTTANEAKTAAGTATSTANTAKSTADAAKSSTDTLETLIRQSSDGVEVARKVNGSYTSTKTLMGSDGFYVQDSSGTNLTQIKAESVIVGKESNTHMHLDSSGVSIKGSSENTISAFLDSSVTLNNNHFKLTTTKGERVYSSIDTDGDFTIQSQRDKVFAKRSIVKSTFSEGAGNKNNKLTLLSSSNYSDTEDPAIAQIDLSASAAYTNNVFSEIKMYADNLYINYSRLDDFVTAQGRSGIWYYRKWNSGLAEIWSDLQKLSSANGFFAYKYFTFPFTLVTRYYAQPMLKMITHNSNEANVGGIHISDLDSSGCSAWLGSSDGSAGIVAGFDGTYVAVNVVGTWK